MLIEVQLWGGERDEGERATVEVERVDRDEVAIHVRPMVGYDGNPPASLYATRDQAAALAALLAVAVDPKTRP